MSWGSKQERYSLSAADTGRVEGAGWGGGSSGAELVPCCVLCVACLSWGDGAAQLLSLCGGELGRVSSPVGESPCCFYSIK